MGSEILNPDKFIEQVDESNSLIYLIIGKNEYWSQKIKKKFEQMVPNEEKTMNLGYFDLQETNLDDVINDANSLPFFGEKRLVIVDNPGFLTSSKKIDESDQNISDFVNYIDNPSLETILVIFAPYEKLDARKKVVKSLKKSANIFDFNQMTEADIKKYVMNYINENEYKIDSGDFDFLFNRVAGDLSNLMNELQKLFIYTTDKIITKKAIEELVPRSLEQNVFNLVNYVFTDQTFKAIQLYKDLLLQNYEPLQLNAILVSQFRLLLQVMILSNNGYSQGSLANVLKSHPYRIKLAIKTIKNLNIDYLRSGYLGLVEIENQLKTGSCNPELLFEMYVIKLADKKKKPV